MYAIKSLRNIVPETLEKLLKRKKTLGLASPFQKNSSCLCYFEMKPQLQWNI